MIFKQKISEEIFIKKYMINGETKFEDVFEGVAKEISSVEKNNKKHEKIFETIMKEGNFIPGGRILANARVNSKLKQYNNCFTIDIEDSMEGIFDSIKEDALISAEGGGVGFNISKLRPEGSIISKGGDSSGPLSFLKVFNQSAQVIHTGGSRRSAHIAIMNVDHPDIEKFITIKQGNELTQFNISVGITDKFINAVKNNLDWDLVFNNKIYKTIKATNLWNLITNNAFNHNEPGILNIDLAQKYNNGYYAFNINSCNPCLTGDALVLTPKGYVRADSLNEGNEIITKNNTTSIIKTKEINFDKKVKEYLFSNNLSLKATDSHIFYSYGNEKKASTLKIGDKIDSVGGLVDILDIRDVDGLHTVYDFFEETTDSWIANGIINRGCGEICVAGDTKINTDHGIITIIDLISIYKSGKEVKVLSSNKDGKLELKKVLWGDKTGKNIQLIKFEFKNGKKLRVTPNHKLFISPTETITAGEYITLWNSLYKTNIKRGEYPHFMFLNRSMQNESYIKVKTSVENEYVLEHHIMYGEFEEGYNIHHINGNTLNNHKDNLEKISHSEHSKLSNIGHDNYKYGRLLKKSARKHHGDVPNSNILKSVKWTGLEDTYDITVEDNSNFFAEGILVHNCMPPYSMCDLGALFLPNFVENIFTDESYFDYEKFDEYIKYGIRFLDDVLDATDYPLEKIKTMAKDWRRIGLGFTGLATALTMMQKTYGEESGNEVCEKIASTLRNSSYKYSSLLAKEKGSFKKFNKKKILDAEFIKNLPKENIELIKKYGLRNIAMNTVAPTGTISLTVGNNCSSGIEPIFSLEYDRTIRTGKGEETTKEKVYDYGYLLFKDKFPNVELPSCFKTTFDIDPFKAINVQSIFQKYIDHSISKTSNLPNNYSFENYKNLFMYAYDKGLKGFTSFNPSGSLVGILENKNNIRREAPKRPINLECDIHEIFVNKERFIVSIGKLEESIYEIFVIDDKENFINIDKHKVGTLRKRGKGLYDLITFNGEEKIAIEDISKKCGDEYAALSRFISMSLRHKVPLEFIIDQLAKSNSFVSFGRVVARVLKKYIKNGEISKSSSICPECGSEILIYIDGCLSCTCGWSRCQ